MSSAEHSDGDHSQEPSPLYRQNMRADQGGIVNSKAGGYRISRLADWISRKVNLAGDVLSRYRSTDTTGDNSTLLLAPAIIPGNEPKTMDSKVQRTDPELNFHISKFAESSLLHHNGATQMKQSSNDMQTISGESQLTQNKNNEFKSPVERIAARVNETGLTRGTQIQRKADKALGLTSERMTSVSRQILRSSTTDTQNVPVITAGFSSPMELQQQLVLSSDNQLAGNENTSGKSSEQTVNNESSISSTKSKFESKTVGPNQTQQHSNSSLLFHSNQDVMSSYEVKHLQKNYSPQLFRSANISEISNKQMVTNENSAILTRENKSPLVQKAIPAGSQSDHQKIFRKPINPESKISTKNSDPTTNSQVQAGNIHHINGENSKSVFNDVGGSESLTGNPERTVSNNSSALMNSQEIKLSGKDELMQGTIIHRSIDKSDKENVTNRLLSRAVVPNTVINQNSRTAYDSVVSSEQKISGSFAQSSDSESTENSKPLLFRKENQSFSNGTSEGTRPVTVNPLFETVHSSPVNLIWRKSDSTVNAKTYQPAGGIKDIHTIAGSALSRKEETGAGNGQSSQSGATSENKNTASQNVIIDIEQIAEQIERLLSRKMLVERERRGELM